MQQRNNGSLENKSNDQKDNQPSSTENATELMNLPVLDCSEAAEDADIAKLRDIMGPLASQLNVPAQSENRRMRGRRRAEPILATLSDEEKAAIDDLPTFIKELLIDPDQVGMHIPNFVEPFMAIPGDSKEKEIEIKDAEKISLSRRNINSHIWDYLGYTPHITNSLKEEKKQVPFHIKEYLTNPAHLEEYARDEYGYLVKLGRIPNKLIGEYLGNTPEYVASLLTPNEEQQREAIAILKRFRNRLVAKAEADRKKAEHQIENLLIDLMVRDVEHPELALMDTMSKYTIDQRARVTAVNSQYWKAGYFAIHQPEATLYRIIESHFNDYEIKPEAATCVFSGLTPLSSNAVPANPLCWMHDVIVLRSFGMCSTVATYVKNGANIKVMGSIGTDATEYQKHFAKMATERKIETKDNAQYNASKGAETKNIGAAHVVTKSAREAMLDGVFKYLPTPEPFVVPEDHVILFVSCQTDDWLDFMIKGSHGDYIDFRNREPLKSYNYKLCLHPEDNKLPDVKKGELYLRKKQDLFLMSKTDENNYKVSELGSLYLYKNEKGEVLYKTAGGLTKLEEKVSQSVKDLKFDQPEKNPVKCNNQAACESILGFASNLYHIQPYIAYTVITPKGDLVRDVRLGFLAPDEFTLENLSLMKNWIMQEIRAKGDIEEGDILALHSSDFRTPEGLDDVLEYNKKDRVDGSHNYHQIVVYIPKQAGRDPSHHHVAAAAYSGAFEKGVKQSCYAFIVKPTGQQLNKLITSLSSRDNRYDASTIVKELTKEVKPFFALPSTGPYADAGAWGFEPLSIYYDGQKTFVNVWGLPLKFHIQASGGGTDDWGKFIQDLDRVIGFDQNKAQRQILIEREKRAQSQARKEAKAANPISMNEISDKHDQLREVTALLMTHKLESKEQESLILNPAMLCYQKIRQGVVEKIAPQLMGCYVRAELEAEMLRCEKERVAEIKKWLIERRQFNATQVQKEVAAAQKINRSINAHALTQQLLMKKEVELTQLMQERNDLSLNDFYQTKLNEDMMTLKMDPTQCYRFKLHESVKKLAKGKMDEVKDVIQPLLEENDEVFNRHISQFQLAIKQTFNAFCEEEAKDRDAKLETPRARAERESKEAKENDADKAVRLANEAVEKAKYIEARKQILVGSLQGPINQMINIIKDKIDDLGFNGLVTEQEIADRLINYLWSLVETKYQARRSTALRGFFQGKLPINETDLGEETIDAKAELAKLANVPNATLYDFTLKQQEMNAMIKNPEVLAKIGKFTSFVFSLFKVDGEEQSADNVTGASAGRYLKRVRRPGDADG